MSESCIYRLWCNTEEAYVETEYLNSEPTECPNNPAHEIDTDSICIIKTAEVKVQYSFAFWRGTNPYIEIDSTSWSTVAAFRYLGSDACPITKVICIVSRAGTTGTSKWRQYNCK